MLGASLIGLSGVFVRISEVGPTATAMYRFFFSIPILWAWMAFDNTKEDKPALPSKPEDYLLLFFAGVCFAFDLFTWHWSITLTTIVNATLFNNFTGIFVALFAWLILKEKPSLKLLLAILLSMGGGVILLGRSLDFGVDHLMGDLLAFSSAIFYSGYIIISKHLRNFFTSTTILAWSALPSFYALCLMLVFENEVIMPQTIWGWATVACLALVVHIFGQGFLNYSMKHVTATFAAITLMMSPLTAAICGWLFFNETMGLMELTGSVIILIGIMVARGSNQQK